MTEAGGTDRTRPAGMKNWHFVTMGALIAALGLVAVATSRDAAVVEAAQDVTPAAASVSAVSAVAAAPVAPATVLAAESLIAADTRPATPRASAPAGTARSGAASSYADLAMPARSQRIGKIGISVGDTLDPETLHVISRPGLYGLGRTEGSLYGIKDGTLLRFDPATMRLQGIIRHDVEQVD